MSDQQPIHPVDRLVEEFAARNTLLAALSVEIQLHPKNYLAIRKAALTYLENSLILGELANILERSEVVDAVRRELHLKDDAQG